MKYQVHTNDTALRKFAFMSLVVLLVYAILGIVGFYLWFVFPVEKVHGLTYMKTNHLAIYYSIINFNDILGVLFFSHFLYFRPVKTSNPVKDGISLGIYLVVFSWILDLFIYVFVRKTLPDIDEYFLGKNQPEIGIAWLIAFMSAYISGRMHRRDKNGNGFTFRKAGMALMILTIAAIALTVTGIYFFDVEP